MLLRASASRRGVLIEDVFVLPFGFGFLWKMFFVARIEVPPPHDYFTSFLSAGDGVPPPIFPGCGFRV